MNCDKIHPLQQKKVQQLYDELLKNETVQEITIFGSSVTERCHSGSDVDIYVTLEKNEKNLITVYMPFLFDLWTNYTVDERLLSEIKKTGVKIYERNITD
jgi:predicted nucleotidyltransferase